MTVRFVQSSRSLSIREAPSTKGSDHLPVHGLQGGKPFSRASGTFESWAATSGGDIASGTLRLRVLARYEGPALARCIEASLG